MKAAIFTGSRHWIDRATVSRVFDQVRPDVVIEGGANGLDTIAKWEALERDIKVITFPANWNRFGRGAGSIRNKEMLDKLLDFKKKGYEVSVEAFPMRGSIGTPNMMKLAEEAGINVRKYRASKNGHPMGRKSRKL